MLKEEVDEEDIAKLVSKWTGIPTGRLLEGEAQKLVKMEERLRQRVVGQEDALDARVERRAPQPRGIVGHASGRSARSFFSVRPVSAKPSWRARWRNFCSTTKS